MELRDKLSSLFPAVGPPSDPGGQGGGEARVQNLLSQPITMLERVAWTLNLGMLMTAPGMKHLTFSIKRIFTRRGTERTTSPQNRDFWKGAC